MTFGCISVYAIFYSFVFYGLLFRVALGDMI